MPCVPSTESRDYVFELGGKGTEVILSLSILKADWIRALAYIVPTPEAVSTPLTVDDAISNVDSTQVLADDMTNLPRSGEIIVYRQRRYRIQSVRMDDSETVMRLELEDIN